MRIALDRSSPEPLWEQLFTAIAERIRRGSLAPGRRLPTVRALAGDLELAPNTVAKAYRALEDQGLIVGQGRRGTFVTDRLPKRLTDRELALGEAADAFVRRGRQLGFGGADIRRALSRALRERPSS
ncbi:MAG TPA: GntR family transcriptional regulator [Actinomycetota bacterium]|nr:GntR family transcriptional regulator [Actinomycetota bacterium]